MCPKNEHIIIISVLSWTSLCWTQNKEIMCNFKRIFLTSAIRIPITMLCLKFLWFVLNIAGTDQDGEWRERQRYKIVKPRDCFHRNLSCFVTLKISCTRSYYNYQYSFFYYYYHHHHHIIYYCVFIPIKRPLSNNTFHSRMINTTRLNNGLP
jgi:hypothetical protein